MYKIIRPILFLLSADYAHKFVAFYMKNIFKIINFKNIVRKRLFVTSTLLEQKICGLVYKNPVGLAAGFDKNGTMLDFLEMLGLGFIEVGSVTYNSSKGNPFPRMVRLKKERALINRCGLNNQGAHAISRRLLSKRSDISIPIGVNISKTHDPNIMDEDGVLDYRSTFDLVKGCGDYITLNVSCPNTAEGKTFESPEALRSLLTSINPKSCLKPIFLKISPGLDESELFKLIDIAESFGISGYVLSNTSKDRSLLKEEFDLAQKFGNGGLSGRPLKEGTFKLISIVYKIVGPSKVIIASGGIETAEDAYEAIARGASLVQIYSALIFDGPMTVYKINKKLQAILGATGMNVTELRGKRA